MGLSRGLYAGAVALTFLGSGLWIGGATGRVHALVRAAVSSPDISPIEGSRCATPRQVVLDGQPARLRRCVAPRNMSLVEVRKHYEAVALAESHSAGGKKGLPYVAAEQPDGAYVLWTSETDGHRKGVILTRGAEAIEYMLLDSSLPASAGFGTTVLLPGGAKAPAGARGGLTVEDGGSSYSFFFAPGPPREVASQVQTALGETGFEVDASSASEIDGVNQAPGGAPSRVVVPLKGKDHKGFLIVAPSGPGTSRATLVVR